MIVSYEEQIYLLYFYLRTNMKSVTDAMDKGDPVEIRQVVAHELSIEYGIKDDKVIDEITELLIDAAE